jgi:glycosyltransferase involved in cell wall biosynthesis
MRIGLYNPYLSQVMGGGERHFLSIAQCLAKNHQPEIILASQKIGLKDIFRQQFDLDLSQVKLINGPFKPTDFWWERLRFTRQYDIFYYMTDGSFFISAAKKNIVHFQIPFSDRPSFLQRLKLNAWPVKTANSSFTKDYLEKNWHIKIDYVHRGSVDTLRLKPGKKQNIILNVGRFISGRAGKHCKRQDFLVQTFKKLCDKGLKDWQLILHGPVEKGKDNQHFAAKVKELSHHYPIKICHQTQFKDLIKDYARAKIYWHATGYGVDASLNPQAVEHLGLTTVEAMAAGAVPVVINKGGQPEIVSQAFNGLLWNNQRELIKATLSLIKDESLRQKLARHAHQRAQDFSQAKFCQLTKKIFQL